MIRASTASLALVLALAACRKDAAAPGGPLAETTSADAGQPLHMSVTADEEVALGDDVVFHVKLENAGKSAVSVNVPRIERSSMTFRVRREDGTLAKIERIVGDVDARGAFTRTPNAVKTLEPGASFTTDVATLAVQAGKLAFTPVYVLHGGEPPLASDAIEVTVKPKDPDKPRLGVLLSTTHGDLTIALRPDIAYDTCESFASLSKKGFYDGTKFHRIIAGMMAQGGDPRGNGTGGPGYQLPLEASGRLLHRRGVISMARTNQPDTAGSQFFLMFTTYPSLDPAPGNPGYSAFGETVSGDETLTRLAAVRVGRDPRDPQAAPPLEDVHIKKATLTAVP